MCGCDQSFDELGVVTPMARVIRTRASHIRAPVDKGAACFDRAGGWLGGGIGPCAGLSSMLDGTQLDSSGMLCPVVWVLQPETQVTFKDIPACPS